METLVILGGLIALVGILYAGYDAMTHKAKKAL